MSPPESLICFCKHLEDNDSLKEQIAKASNPSQIIELAKSNGFVITVEELRIWSRELKAPYFPWAQMGHEWRRKFFTLT